MGRKHKDITGKRFGKLIATKRTREANSGRESMWLCKCDCGNETIIRISSLNNGNTRSCGCLHTEAVTNGIKNVHKVNKSKYLKENTNLQLLDSEMNKNNTSGTKGVSWSKTRSVWIATMTFKGEVVLYERFTSKQDAINARKEAEEKYFKPILEKYGKTQ